MTSVLIVGAGQLGSRYLEGLRGVSRPLSIVVNDLDCAALEVAQKRWEEAVPAAEHEKPVFIKSMAEAMTGFESGFDLVIVSTSAGPRLETIKRVSEAGPVRYWILEKLLAQASVDVRAILKHIGSSARAFVNTPRRIMTGYAELRQRLVPPLDVRVNGGMWGLASNAVHMIDTVEWLAGDVMTNLMIHGRPEGWYATKRPGHLDMTGRITVEFARGSRLVMEAHDRQALFTMTVTDSLDSRWVIDQSSGSARLETRDSLGLELQVPLEMQSAMTPRVVEELLSTGRCGLPTLEESARVHIPLLDELLRYWNASTGASDSHLPIT